MASRVMRETYKHKWVVNAPKRFVHVKLGAFLKELLSREIGVILDFHQGEKSNSDQHGF